MRVILGTMTFGATGVGSRIKDPAKVQQVLDQFKSFGFNELDTARMYCKGATEEMLASLKVQHPPQSFSVATKAYPFNAGDHSPEKLKKQFRASLEALNTSRVDIFYLHAPDSATPFEETLRAVQDLYEEGTFGEFALSNFAAWQVVQIYYICKKNNYILPTLYQGMYNAITRDVEKELLPALAALGIRFYAYNPLAGGILAGKLQPQGPVEPGSRFDPNTAQGNRYRQRYWNTVYFDAVEHVKNACQHAGISLVDASLRWYRHYSKLDFEQGDGVIIGASSLEQLQENMGALVNEERLPQAVAEAFDMAWEQTRSVCQNYFR